MFAGLKRVVGGLLTSKKFVATIVGVGGTLLVRYTGLEEAAAEAVSLKIVALVGLYVLGQGIADHGKEKVKAEFEAMANGDTEAEE